MAHDPLRIASRHAARAGERLVEADRHGQDPGELRVRDEIGRRQRLLDAEDVEVGQPAQTRHVVLAAAEGAVRIDLEHEVRVVPPQGAHRLDLPPGLDLEASPRRTGPHRGIDLLAQPLDVTVGRNAEDGAHGHRLEPGSGPQGLRHGTPLGAELGVPGGHLEGGGEHAVDGRAPEELRHLRPAGEMPSPRAGRPLEARHPAVGRRPLDLGQRGVHRCAPFEGGALPPALAVLGHHPDEEQRSGPVHAGGGADVVTEGEIDADELHPDQLHGDEAPTPSP